MSITSSILHIMLIFGLSFIVSNKQTASLRRFFWPALTVKLLAGVLLGLLYIYYYNGGDTFVYFADAVQLADVAREDLSSYLALMFFDSNPGLVSLTFDEPRALFLTKVTSVFSIVTADQYWICGLYFSFISFLAAWFLVRTIATHIPSARLAALVAFLFFPSIVFWTSGLLKESLAIGAIFFLTALFLKVWFGVKPAAWEYVLAVLSLLVSWHLKYYYLAVFIPVTVTCLFFRYVIKRRFRASPVVEVLVWLAILLMPLLTITFLHPNFNLDRILGVMVTNNAVYHELSEAEGLVHFIDLRDTPLSMLRNAVPALFSGLFRPLIWETKTIIPFLAGIENTLLFVLFVGALWRFKTLLHSPHRLLVLGVAVYVILLCVFITVSTPNFGTLSRYRVGYLAFFVFMIFCNNPVLQWLERSFSRLVSH